MLGPHPLTTNDDYRHRPDLDTCYQFAQSISKVCSVLEERVGQGKVGGWQHEAAVAAGCRKALLCPTRINFLLSNAPFTLWCLSGILGSFQSGGTVYGLEALTIIKYSVMNGVVKVKKLQRMVIQISRATSRNQNTSKWMWETSLKQTLKS